MSHDKLATRMKTVCVHTNTRMHLFTDDIHTHTHTQTRQCTDSISFLFDFVCVSLSLSVCQRRLMKGFYKPKGFGDIKGLKLKVEQTQT